MGKYPPLWGIGALIDDFFVPVQQRKFGRILGKYGFTMIDPNSLESDTAPEVWVDRVLAGVDQWQSSLK